jgi:hypothetical protein
MRLLQSLRSALTFLVVLTIVLFVMQKAGMIDVGSGAVSVIDGGSLA